MWSCICCRWVWYLGGTGAKPLWGLVEYCTREVGQWTAYSFPTHQRLYSAFRKHMCLFRWFKFKLKPPYTIAHGNLLSAIWDTSHWTSFVKFRLKTAWDISYDILWLILKYVNFWLLQGHLSTLGKILGPQKINFFLNEGATRLQWG